MKVLKKEQALEENNKQGTAERNHYILTSASCNARHFTDQTGTDCYVLQKQGESGQCEDEGGKLKVDSGKGQGKVYIS